jgi:hypothetical protein
MTLGTDRIKFSRATRTLVAKASDGGPSLGTFLARINAIGDAHLTTAIDGIWCGRSGDVRLDIEGAQAMLCIGWYNARVEWSYLS